MADQNQLATTIKTISEKQWAEKDAPVLLSALPPMLERELPDYRTVLGTRSLKVFIKETGETAGYRLVEHPTLRAKVGVVPAIASYEFPAETPPSSKAVANSNKEVTLAFFRALATLPDADLEKMVIPASVLVKLLK